LSTPIDLLAALQEVDQRLRQKESTLQELRQQISASASAVETKQQEAEAQRLRLNELESRQRATELQLKEEEGKIKEKRVRQNRIRNERELMAVRHEVELMKEANEKIEEDGIRLLEQIEQEKTRLVQTQTEIEALKGKMTAEAGRVETQIASLESEVQQERNERERFARDIDADLCARYERIFAKRGGIVVVEIRSDTCQGCYMRIPPHMSNQIRSSVQVNAHTIFHCPHCGRILHWRPTAEGESDV
jgi:predicted  nucleic acid-binding Zn-ribbon protein